MNRILIFLVVVVAMVVALLVPLAIPAKAASLTLACDANSEADLAGYKVYYKTGASGPPYDGTGFTQGSSGIFFPLGGMSDPSHPQFTLTGVSEGVQYRFAVTAYNNDNAESGYSNEVTYLIATPDQDGDNVADAEDVFPNDSSEWTDYDGDGIGDNADLDDDNDGHLDTEDAFPQTASEWLDTDGDGIGNNADSDDDNDGHLDTEDAFPQTASEWLDTDGDGIGNNADPDDDNDGIKDAVEILAGTDSLDENDFPLVENIFYSNDKQIVWTTPEGVASYDIMLGFSEDNLLYPMSNIIAVNYYNLGAGSGWYFQLFAKNIDGDCIAKSDIISTALDQQPYAITGLSFENETLSWDDLLPLDTRLKYGDSPESLDSHIEVSGASLSDGLPFGKYLAICYMNGDIEGNLFEVIFLETAINPLKVTGLAFSGSTLTWNPVAGAESYKVYLPDFSYLLATPNTNSVIVWAGYNVQVSAIFNGAEQERSDILLTQ